MRCLFAVLLGFALSLPLFGQYSYNYALSMVDNTPYCAVINCLTSIGGITVETKAGYDGTIYGLTSNHTLFTYTKAGGWVVAPSALQTAGGSAITHISVGSKSQVLALNSAVSPGNNVYVLNSTGTAWQTLSHLAYRSPAEIGPDGSIWGMYGSVIDYWNGTTWANEPGSLKNIAVASGSNVWGVYGGVLYNWTGTAWVALSPTPPFTPSSAVNAIAAVGENRLAVLDTSGHIHVSTNSGQAWSTIAGTASSITGGGTFLFVANSSGASHHVNLVVPAITTTGTGTYAQSPFCINPPGCSTYTHTMTVNSKFGGLGGAHGTAGATNTQSALAATNFNLSVTEYGVYCDPFFGSIPSDPSCGPAWDGGAGCSGMGDLGGNGGTLPLPFFGVASTLVANLSGPAGYNCSQHGTVTDCWWNTAPNCANTSSPVWSPSSIYDSPPGLAGWWSIGACVRAGTSQPWSCFAVPGKALKTTQTTPGNCTGP